MKYRIGALVMGPLLIWIPFQMYADDADPLKDAPILTAPLVIRDSDTFESAVQRLLDGLLWIETTYRHNLRESAARAERFALIQSRVARYVGAVVTSSQLRAALLEGSGHE